MTLKIYPGLTNVSRLPPSSLYCFHLLMFLSLIQQAQAHKLACTSAHLLPSRASLFTSHFFFQWSQPFTQALANLLYRTKFGETRTDHCQRRREMRWEALREQDSRRSASRQEPAKLLCPPKIHGSILLNFILKKIWL